MADGYDDSNRAFLQAFMGRSSMTFEEAQPVLAAIFTAQSVYSPVMSDFHEENGVNHPITIEEENVDPNDVTQEHLSSYIDAANTAISPFDLEIRSLLHQTPKQADQENNDSPPSRVYALVNTTSDPLTQLATTYSADEIAFVKRLLDFMFDTNNTRICEGMVITPMQSLNLRSSAEANRRRSTNATQQTQGGATQSLTITQAENMMKHLVEEGWLEKSRKDYFSLTPRALMELRGWLISEYNDEMESGRRMNRIKFCSACKDIITVVCVFLLYAGSKSAELTRIIRDNAARTAIAWAASMTIACAASFVCNGQNSALSAKKTGQVTSSSAKEL